MIMNIVMAYFFNFTIGRTSIRSSTLLLCHQFLNIWVFTNIHIFIYIIIISPQAMSCVVHKCSGLNSVLPHQLNNRALLEDSELHLLCLKTFPYLICYINVERPVKCWNSNRHNDAVFLQFQIFITIFLHGNEEN
jgi:hypothetical protein